MKKTVCVFLIVVISLFLFSCSGKRNNPLAPAPTSTPTCTPEIGSISGMVNLSDQLTCCYWWWWDYSPPYIAFNTTGNVTTMLLPTPNPTTTLIPTPSPTEAPTFDPIRIYPPILPIRPYACATSIPTPYQGAVVQALLNGVVKGTTTTAADGRYRIDNLSPGIYNLKITYPHYDIDYSLATITVRAGVETADHNLFRSKEWQEGKIQVYFNAGVTDMQAQSVIASHGCTVDSSDPVSLYYLLTIPGDKTPREMTGIFMQDPVVYGAYTYWVFYSCGMYVGY